MPARPLTLANEVISHNKKRQSKRLHLTRGFGGATTLTFSRTEPEMVATLVGKIERLHQSGVSLAEMAVLVRLNAQTTLLEQALISRQIPYRNANPFYEWPEIQTRMQYGRLGLTRTHFQQLMTATAMNIERAARWLLGERPKVTHMSSFSTLVSSV